MNLGFFNLGDFSWNLLVVFGNYGVNCVFEGVATVTLVTLFGGLISIFWNLGFDLVPESNLGFQALIKYFSNL